MQIATCKNRKQRQYFNQEMSWEEFTKKLLFTTRTKETVEEYKNMTKDQQSNIKDVGGFVAGELKDGRRNNQSVLSRSMITLDADFADRDFLDLIRITCDFCSVIYSTHKHTPEKPKYRWIIPLQRGVSPEEYEAIARRIASTIGMEYFDDTTYQPARMMFWPSTSKDGEYICEELGDRNADLNPDDILAQYRDWHDISYWPRSNRETELHHSDIRHQEDPLSKSGWIGAFCRAYTIQEAIETFIPEEYTPTEDPNRWTYTNGSTAGGLVIYDDKYAYSNHNTDPTGQQLCNAYDLVRIHKWPDDPASTEKMQDLMSSDKNTKKQLIEDKRERLHEDWNDFQDDTARGSQGVEDSKEEVNEDWLDAMDVDKKGNFKPTTDNIVRILLNDPKLKNGVGGNDLFAQKPVKKGNLPWWNYNPSDPTWTDTDDASFRYYLEKKYNIVAKGKVDDAIAYVQERNSFHPVRDYLDTLEWDGIPRLDTLFIDYLGSEDSEYSRAVARKAFTAAVARIYTPGCKMDYMPVLVGHQGIGKSHMLSIMGGDWFSDSITTISGKEGYEALHGSWVIEWSELSAARKADIESMKQFISKRDDRYRKAYARRVTDNPRQCVFFGTTNDDEFLRDYTGNRRFWPINTDISKAKKVVFDDLPKERDQIWAEAKQRFKDGEKLFLQGEALTGAEQMQKEHTFTSVREDMVRDYLDRKLPDGWKDMDLYARTQWLEDPKNKGEDIRDCVSLLEIWCEVLNGAKNKFTPADQRELKAIMESLGWNKGPAPRQRGACYGKQRVYLNPKFTWENRNHI